MPVIKVLSPHIANQIAAGEVVERPASIVKELVENALDAGATEIMVEIENGGVDLIRVTDNGCGMGFDDAATAFLRHATSKISNADDLFHIATLGFRGEALPSIASVSDVTMKTIKSGEEQGTLVHIRAGEMDKHTLCAYAKGTMIETRALFENVPARLKFLKSIRTEAGYVSDYISRMIMARPDVSFTHINNGRQVYRSTGTGSLRDAVLSVYGSDILPHLRELSFDDGYLEIKGFCGTDAISRPNRMQQSIFLNGRYIKSVSLSAALQRAYETRLMQGRFPFAVIAMKLATGEVDVNVHPGKMEVRFIDEQRIIRSVTACVKKALIDSDDPGFFSNPSGYAEPTDDAVGNEAGDTAANDGNTGSFVPAGSFGGTHMGFQASGDGFRFSSGRASGYDIRSPHYEDGQPRFHESGYASYPSGSVNRTTASEDRPITLYPADGENDATAADDGLISGADMLGISGTDADYKLVGNVFNGYWIIQKDDALFFIDQHAAHERTLYERLMKKEAEIISQQLAVPMEPSLSPEETALLTAFRAPLEDIGYAFDLSGESAGKVLVTAVPSVMGTPLSERYLHEALEALREEGRTSGRDLKRARLIQCACKHAVKATECLQKEEIASLLETFRREGIPMTCPHGRPVMVSMKKIELEKLFKRVL